MLREAVDLTPHGHPFNPRRLSGLTNSFIIRFRHHKEESNLVQAISLYSHAASAPVGSVRVRFQASQSWISYARHIHHHSLLHAYSVAIGLFPQLAWIGLPLDRRLNELRRGPDVVQEAAAAALDSGLPETALEWLEQGRSIVLGDLFQLRNSYEELSSAHPDHARRLRDLSAALEHAGATRENSFCEQTESPAQRATGTSQEETDSHRTLATKRDKLLQEIRHFPGFEQFLLRKQFSQLRTSVHSGPVVILNAAKSRCDALIVLADLDHVIHVPTFTFQQSAGLQNLLEKLLGHARGIRSDEREGTSAARHGVSWESLLSILWNGVVKPVLDSLAFSEVMSHHSNSWLIPSSRLLVTYHEFSGVQLAPSCSFLSMQLVCMAPSIRNLATKYPTLSSRHTLSILSLAPDPDVAPSGDLRLLAVRQPPSDGQPHLPGVETELRHIRAIARDYSSAQTVLVESSLGTVEEILDLMKEADWVHFACHGIQDAEKPTESGLCLADQRRLRVSDMIALSRPRGGLAFLSACQTAMGDEGLSDEAIHIAAGMLFAGYGGVVGSMWSISDKIAPDVARDVYAQLFRTGTRPDYREAARALHEAIGRLRESGASFVQWLPFIHVGL